jgi:hypothetical protein
MALAHENGRAALNGKRGLGCLGSPIAVRHYPPLAQP